MNKNRDDEQSPKLSAAGSELKDRLGLEPVLVGEVWHYRIKDIQKALNHVPIEEVFEYLRSEPEGGDALELATGDWATMVLTYRETIKLVLREVYWSSGRQSLSSYGEKGCGDHYKDHLTRIDRAILLLQQAKSLFVAAEKLRKP